MKAVKLFFIYGALIFITGCTLNNTRSDAPVSTSSISELLNSDGRSIEAFYDLNINGCKQRVLIQSDNVRNNPILLYLHGGPGSSLMMYSHLYDTKLKKNFIYVNWDMRGAALSYHEGMDASKISEGQFADDALVLINYLQNTFGKKKIYLIGHSFGSVLGMYLVDKHPELFNAYIGIGQVINYDKSVKLTYTWLHRVLEENGDEDGLKRIEEKEFPYIDLVIKYGGHHNLSIDLNEQVKKSPYYFDGYLELLKKGKIFSSTNTGKNAKRFGTIENIRKSSVPLYFFEGKKDHVIACSPELVVEYCRTVDAPVRKVVWFENSAHYVPVEEPEKFQREILKVLKETGKN